MADRVANARTSLSCEEALARAVQFFATQKFRTSSQSPRAVTFDGMPPIPWFMLLFTILGFIFCIVPGIIMYFMFIAKMRRFQNMVVTASPIQGGTEVSISHPSWAGGTVARFLRALPPLMVTAPPPVPPVAS